MWSGPDVVGYQRWAASSIGAMLAAQARWGFEARVGDDRGGEPAVHDWLFDNVAPCLDVA